MNRRKRIRLTLWYGTLLFVAIFGLVAIIRTGPTKPYGLVGFALAASLCVAAIVDMWVFMERHEE